MKIIDTHTHIYSEEFDQDIDVVVERARMSGVVKALLPNIDVHSIDQLQNLLERYPDFCLPMMGLHPNSVDKDWISSLCVIRKQLEKNTYIGIGEIGIDLYWDTEFKAEQCRAFEEQLYWSNEYNLPVSIHSRDAIDLAVKSIKRIGKDKVRGVFHSFIGNSDQLRSVLSLGSFLIGINGVVTFKNSVLPIVLKETDLSNIVIETDAPYLAPMPYRGKRNEPSYTVKIIEKLAEIYNTTPEQVAEITTANAMRMFDINI